MQRSVGFTIADHVTDVNGGILVMSTSGRGRSEAILGSVAVDILREMLGPLVPVGPKANDRVDFRGELIVPVDGSDLLRDDTVPGRCVGHRLRPVHGSSRSSSPIRFGCDDAIESSYVARLARDIRRHSHHDAQFEVLQAPVRARRSVTSPKASARR